MAHYYVLLGPPGAGKGTQASRLAEHLNIPHVSTGDMFRAMKTLDTPLARKVQEIMAKGALVPDGVTLEIVEDRLSQPDCANGAILDGFPRTLAQADGLATLLTGSFNSEVTNALMFEVSLATILQRINTRREETLAAGEEPRADDTEEAATKRYMVYLENTAPLIGYYHAKGKLERIDGEQSIDDVTADMLNTVNAAPA
jgi:adenylate kinase